MIEDVAPQETIRIVAAMIRDDQGRCLLVRKAGSSIFMQAGGKPRAQEEPLDTLDREIHEELGCRIDRETAEFDGSYMAAAAHEPGCRVSADIYRIRLLGTPAPCSEIEEIIWIDPGNPDDVPIAPLTSEHVLPRISKWVGRSSSAMASGSVI